ncbi:tetratricopeptide repeat protein [Patescibacteria group bacterium]|nr:tetratricopeptide repeat protein [Patescibacteria group bacterium]
MNKKFIILLIVFFLCSAGATVFLFKDYFFSSKSQPTVEETWDFEKYLAIGYDQEQIDRLFAELSRLNSSLENNPNDYNTLLKVGNIYMMLEEYEKAEVVFLQIIEIEPSFAPAHANLGELYGSFWEEKSKAVDYYKKAIELHPWRSQYYRSLADLYRSDFPEKKNEIESLILSGIKEYPGNIDFYTYLASYFTQENNIPKAIDYLEQALEIEPDNAVLKQELIELEGH